MASTRVRSLRRDRFRDGDVSVGRPSRRGNPFLEGRPLRVGSEIVVRSIDNGGSTIRALPLTVLRLQGSALAAALASPAVSSALADVSYRTGAGHITGLSVVYHQVEPLTTVARESAVSPEQEFEVAWRGGDGLLDQMPDPEPIDGSPTRAAVDWHEVAKHAPDVEHDERSMPAVADRKVLRRRGRVTVSRVTVRRGFLRPPMSAEAVARMVELRAQGLGFGRIARAIGCARITVSRYLRSFEEETDDRCRDVKLHVLRPDRPSRETSLTPYSDTPRHRAGA